MPISPIRKAMQTVQAILIADPHQDRETHAKLMQVIGEVMVMKARGAPCKDTITPEERVVLERYKKRIPQRILDIWGCQDVRKHSRFVRREWIEMDDNGEWILTDKGRNML